MNDTMRGSLGSFRDIRIILDIFDCVVVLGLPCQGAYVIRIFIHHANMVDKNNK